MKTLETDQLLSALQWRYATKLFDSQKKIPAEIWATLEESLRLTPSSFGLQPWHFLVVSSDEMRATLLPHSWNQPQVTDCSHFLIIASNTEITEAQVDRFVTQTAADRGTDSETLRPYRDMMVGFLNRMSPEEVVAWAKNQTYIALGQVMTAAALLGVDACPMEGFIQEKYDEILGLTDRKLTASVACAFGYRAFDDKYGQAKKTRYLLDQVVSRLP